jgi:hypothetical protein
MARIPILALLIASLLAGCSSSAAGTSASPAGASTASSATARPAPTGPFPSEVAGLPVMSVARADELLRSGQLDGQAVAVAGYYDQVTPSCPYPGRYIGPLEGWCQFTAFTDSRASARLCHPDGTNGTSCRKPSGTSLAPFFMTETSGNAWSSVSSAASGQPAALVLIGHAGDARQWQCTRETQTECASALVVDRVAWADGQDVPATAPETGGQDSGKVIRPALALDQVAAAAGLGDHLLTAAAFRKGDVATVDPRWNFIGDDIVWLVRSLAPATGSGQTRPETLWLVDDATGKVLDSHPLKVGPDYQPARLWEMATLHGVDCCAGDVLPFYRVTSDTGTAVYEGMVRGGASGGEDGTTYGGGYMSTPLVLPAGGYSVGAWLAPYTGGIAGAPRRNCATEATVQALGDVGLNADFPPGKACTLRQAPSPWRVP